MKQHLLKYIWAYFLLVFCQSLVGQQVSDYSQYRELGLKFNPAMTAPWSYLEAGAIYRQQWVGFDNAPKSALIFAQLPLLEQNMSIGLLYEHDVIAPLQSDNIQLNYAYRIEPGVTSGDQLSMGIGVSGNSFRLTSKDFIARDAQDPLLPDEIAPKGKFDADIGVWYASASETDYDDNFFYVGFAAQRLLTPSVTWQTNNGQLLDFKRERHYNATIGGRIYSSYLFIEPNLMVRYVPHAPLDIHLNVKFELEETFWATGFLQSTPSLEMTTLGLGGGYAIPMNDAFLRIGGGISYALNASGISPGWSYEILTVYRFEP